MQDGDERCTMPVNWFVNVFDFQMVKKGEKVIIVIMIIMMTPTSEENNEQLCGAHDDETITMLMTLFV